jgi:hypothetical protein
VEIKPRASLFALRVTPDPGPTKESTVVSKAWVLKKSLRLAGEI